MRVQVNKCRLTGKLFEDTNKFKIHLAKLRKERDEAFRYNKIKLNFENWLKNEKSNITEIDQIAPWFLKNQRHIMDALNAGVPSNYWASGNDKFYNTDEFTKLVVAGSYSSKLSNSHSCPDNGIQNWCSKDKDKPTDYKGWKVNICGNLKRLPKHMANYPYTDALNVVGIKTGSGGGGNSNFRYDGYIWLDDWPGLYHAIEKMEQENIIARLKGLRMPNFL